jgi:hypothetical protein
MAWRNYAGLGFLRAAPIAVAGVVQYALPRLEVSFGKVPVLMQLMVMVCSSGVSESNLTSGDTRVM